MGVASGIVLFLVIWFMAFMVLLPFGVRTQGEAGSIEPGTHSGAPQEHHLARKAIAATAIACVLWAIAAAVILSGTVSVRDIDVFGRMGPATETPRDGG